MTLFSTWFISYSSFSSSDDVSITVRISFNLCKTYLISGHFQYLLHIGSIFPSLVIIFLQTLVWDVIVSVFLLYFFENSTFHFHAMWYYYFPSLLRLALLARSPVSSTCVIDSLVQPYRLLHLLFTVYSRSVSIWYKRNQVIHKNPFCFPWTLPRLCSCVWLLRWF